MPFGVLGFVAAAALGNLRLAVALLAIAILNRMIQSVSVGWGLIRDPRALRLCWLYPLRDLQGFVVWAASYLSRDFHWRGEMYRFTAGGKIIARDR
jgi:ceramide glucosyltransferase